ncbi:MAG: hypothetical protein ACJAT1_000423 [Marivirga sp.]|jgi:hypothetical protein
MKFIIRTIIIAVAAHFCLLYFPWWSIALCSFLAALLIKGSNKGAFFSGFLAIGFLWLIQAYNIHYSTDGLLSNKVAEIFSLSGGFQLSLVTACIGGLVGGFSALSGLRLRILSSRNRKSRGYYK